MGKNRFGAHLLRKARAADRKLDRWLTYQIDKYSFNFRTADIINYVKRIGGGYRGSDAEWQTVQQYWRRFGIMPKRIWYALYCNEMGSYDPRFIPDPIWFHDIIPHYNNRNMASAYADKGFYNRIITGVKKPETVVKKMAEHYYNGDGEQIITREDAEKCCRTEDHLIFKPSGGSKGAGILFSDRDNQDSMTISAILDSMGGGFVAQRIVKQHADLARLNPSTLNTIRLISFHFKEEVHILSAQLRIGKANARVDNYSAGGSAVAVKSDGWLHDTAVNHDMKWVDTTPNGIKLKEVRVPNYQGVTDTVKRLHCQLPYFDILGWDFAVGEDGTPVMIEFNTKPGQNQIGGKEPTFGDLTDQVLEEVFIKKNHPRNH